MRLWTIYFRIGRCEPADLANGHPGFLFHAFLTAIVRSPLLQIPQISVRFGASRLEEKKKGKYRMKFCTLAAAAAALTLTAAPAVAEVSAERVAAPTAEESELAGLGAGAYVLGAIGLGLIIYGIIEISDDDDDPVSA